MLHKKQVAAFLATFLYVSILFLSSTPFNETNEVVTYPIVMNNVRSRDIEPPPAPIEKPKFSYRNLSAKEKKEVDCLAKNMYHEAKGEPREGIIAVGMVTMNRLYSEKFPRTICEIVYQRTGNVYQFSWVPKKKHLTINNDELYNRILEKAIFVYMNYETMIDMTRGALFFHADYVRPNWSNLKQTAQIGRHIFYTLEQRF